MVVKVFIGDESDYEHEWNQFKEVYNLISEKYSKSDETIYILFNFPVSNRQIDVSILTEKGITLLDLKSYRGKVIGTENGDWGVIVENGEEVPLKTNLFKQLKNQRFAFLEQLSHIRKGNFEHIEEGNLAKIKSWGYFEKGSSYDNEQIGRNARSWFDVITGDNLIEKMRFLSTGYRPKDMDAIVKGLNLKEFSFEKHGISQEKSTFESNWGKQLNVFIPPQNWNKILCKINDSNIITIVGDRNVGKTTTIINLANELKKSGYRILEDKESLINSRGKEDRKEHYHLIHNKNVFILDDLFGKTQYEPSLGNKWVYLLIDILDSVFNLSKIIIGSRRDVIDDFLLGNNELSRCGLLNEFKNSIVGLKFSDYDGKIRKEIFDKNLNFIQLNEKNTGEIINRNIEKITKELLLPGDISYFLQKAKDKVGFQESELDTYIDKAKQQINSIAIDIKSLNDYEKIFLYNIFINQDFSVEDLEVVYLHCLPQVLTNRDYFAECLENFEGKFIKHIIEIQFITDKKHKLDFIHDVYKEAIEKLINTEQVERLRIEEILKKFSDLIRLQSIDEWNTKTTKLFFIWDSNYDIIKFNIYKMALRYYKAFNIQIKDLVFEILDSLSYGLMFPGPSKVVYDPEIDMPEIWDNQNSKILTELFYNYDKFEEEYDYFNVLFKKEETYLNIAYCFAYRLSPKIVIKFQDKLKELSSGNKEVKHLIAKCIIRNYEFLNEDNRGLLFNLGVNKTLLMQFLMHNYTILSIDLKEILEKQIVSSDKTLLIEMCKTFLLNYDFLPNEIKRHYDFIFCLKDELVIKEVGKAFVIWFDRTFSDLNYDPKRENIDEKILVLYCHWLKNKEIILKNYHEIWDLYNDVGIIGTIDHSISNSNTLNIINPKWNNPKYSILKDALEANMIILLKSFNFPSIEDKAKCYTTAFNFYSRFGNVELIENVKNIVNETEEIKLIFLEEINNVIQYEIKCIQNPKNSLKITLIQINLIEKLSKIPNSMHVRSNAKAVLDFIKTSIDNHSMEIVQDDHS